MALAAAEPFAVLYLSPLSQPATHLRKMFKKTQRDKTQQIVLKKFCRRGNSRWLQYADCYFILVSVLLLGPAETLYVNTDSVPALQGLQTIRNW